jgi:hypothetical protein
MSPYRPLPRAIIAVVCLYAVAWMGCKPDTPEASTPEASSSATAKPSPDRLDPGELPPGKEVAFGLKLPRVMTVIRREPFSVHSEGQVQPERVANYLRRNVDAKTIELGSVKTIFDRAVVKGTTAPLLRIEVEKVDIGTRLTVQDLTPPKVDPSLKPEDIWKIHGFDGEGKRLDPRKFE